MLKKLQNNNCYTSDRHKATNIQEVIKEIHCSMTFLEKNQRKQRKHIQTLRIQRTIELRIRSIRWEVVGYKSFC